VAIGRPTFFTNRPMKRDAQLAQVCTEFTEGEQRNSNSRCFTSFSMTDRDPDLPTTAYLASNPGGECSHGYPFFARSNPMLKSSVMIFGSNSAADLPLKSFGM